MSKYFLSLGISALVLLSAAPALANDVSGLRSIATKKIVPVKVIKTLTTKPKVKQSLDYTCAVSATKTRDSEIIAAWKVYAASITTALDTRMDSANAAWLLTDKTARNNAFKALTTTHKKAVVAAKLTFKNAKNTAWKKYVTATKTCKIVSVSQKNSENNDITSEIDVSL